MPTTKIAITVDEETLRTVDRWVRERRYPNRSRAIRAALQEESGLDAAFADLSETWRRETGHLSSITQKALHPAYQRIIGLGSRAVPLILHEMEREPDHWFWALRAITGEDPVPPDDAGHMKRMTDAWLGLGRERGWI